MEASAGGCRRRPQPRERCSLSRLAAARLSTERCRSAHRFRRTSRPRSLVHARSRMWLRLDRSSGAGCMPGGRAAGATAGAPSRSSRCSVWRAAARRSSAGGSARRCAAPLSPRALRAARRAAQRRRARPSACAAALGDLKGAVREARSVRRAALRRVCPRTCGPRLRVPARRGAAPPLPDGPRAARGASSARRLEHAFAELRARAPRRRLDRPGAPRRGCPAGAPVAVKVQYPWLRASLPRGPRAAARRCSAARPCARPGRGATPRASARRVRPRPRRGARLRARGAGGGARSRGTSPATPRWWCPRWWRPTAPGACSP